MIILTDDLNHENNEQMRNGTFVVDNEVDYHLLKQRGYNAIVTNDFTNDNYIYVNVQNYNGGGRQLATIPMWGTEYKRQFHHNLFKLKVFPYSKKNITLDVHPGVVYGLSANFNSVETFKIIVAYLTHFDVSVNKILYDSIKNLCKLFSIYRGQFLEFYIEQSDEENGNDDSELFEYIGLQPV